LFAFGKLKSRAFHALFVFPFQGQGKTKPSRKRAGYLATFGRAKYCSQGARRNINKKYSHRIGRTYPGPPPELEGLDQN
jgi:hypothetical protein